MKINKLVWTSNHGDQAGWLSALWQWGKHQSISQFGAVPFDVIDIGSDGKVVPARTHAQLNRFRVSRKAKGDFICNKSSL